MMRVVALSLFLVVAGCENPNAKSMQGAGPSKPWPELNDFQSGPLMSVGYAAERGDWNAVKKTVTSSEFQSSVAAIEQSSPPSGYQKDALVQSLKDLSAAAERGTKDEVEAKYQGLQHAINHVTSAG